MKKKNKNLKYIFSAVITIVIVSCCLTLAGVVLSDKLSATIYFDKQNANEFYSLEDNTVDIFAVGNSQVLSGFVSAELYKNYGYSTFSIGFGHMPVMAQYHWLKEMLKYQKPKIILLEVSGLYSHNPEVGYFRSYSSLANTSEYKLEGLKIYLGESDIQQYLKYYSDLFGFHTRWSSLSKNDYEFLMGDERKTYGGNGVNNKVALEFELKVENFILKETDTCEEFRSKQALEYIEKIINLCDENDMELILFKTVKDDWSAEKSNGVKRFATEKGLTFIDFNSEEIFNQLKLDLEKDFYDQDHCNINGAIKMTEYLGAFIAENYNLSDYRKDTSKSNLQMEKILEGYNRTLLNNSFSNISTFKEILEKLSNSDYTYAITKNGSINMGEEEENILHSLGFNSNLKKSGNVMLLKSGDKIIKDSFSQGEIVKHGVFLKSLKTYYIKVSNNSLNTRLNSGTTSISGSGYITVSVYDNITDSPVGDFVFDENMNVIE